MAATLSAGLVIRVANSRARVTYCGARMVRRSATSDFLGSGRKAPAGAHLQSFEPSSPQRLIGQRPRINVGTPARRPAFVVPAPPWCTTARQAGKIAAKFITPTTLTCSKWGTLAEVGPGGANQRPLA